MPKYTIEMLGALLKKKRGDGRMREIAKEIGIGPATLMRIENGRTPDINTFVKVCRWLSVEPGQFLGFDKSNSGQADPVVVAAHLRAEQSLKPETAAALTQMMLLAVKMQPKPSPEAAANENP